MTWVAQAESATLAGMAAAARAYAAALSWTDIAARTAAEMDSVLARTSETFIHQPVRGLAQ